MDEWLIVFKGYLNKTTVLWNESSEFVQSVIAITICVAVFYILRFIVITRLENLATKTDNDFDDRLVHFSRQFQYVNVCWTLGLLLFVSVSEDHTEEAKQSLEEQVGGQCHVIPLQLRVSPPRLLFCARVMKTMVGALQTIRFVNRTTRQP